MDTERHLIDYHKVVNDSTTAYVIDIVDRHIGNAKVATSSTNGIANVTLLCGARSKVSSSGATFTGLKYHFSHEAAPEQRLPSLLLALMRPLQTLTARL